MVNRVNADVMDRFEPTCCRCIHSVHSKFCDGGVYYCGAGYYMRNYYDTFFGTHAKRPKDCDSYKRRI